MASSNRGIIHNEQAVNPTDRYFVITLTNFPHLLQRTQYFQQLPNQDYPPPSQQQQQQQVHMAMLHSEEHERILYNTLQFELRESIRAYLQRTRQHYPINLVFDMSNIHE